MVEGGGFEPPKAEPSDLQSDPFGHSGTPPRERSCVFSSSAMPLSTIFTPEFLTFRAPAMCQTRGKTEKNPGATNSRVMSWCRHQESNSGPTDYKSVALPAELYRQLTGTPIKTGAHSSGIANLGAMCPKPKIRFPDADRRLPFTHCQPKNRTEPDEFFQFI